MVSLIACENVCERGQSMDGLVHSYTVLLKKIDKELVLSLGAFHSAFAVYF